MSETFWLNDPSILLNKEYILEVFPKNDHTFVRKIKCFIQNGFHFDSLGFLLTQKVNIIISGVATIMAILVLTIIKKTI